MQKPKRGFTLIELLVVIAIIGVIMSMGVASFMTAQKQARDSSRKQIISQIQTALEQHYVATGTYPEGDVSSAFENGQAPTDPKNESPYTLDYQGITSDAYCVCATLENSSSGNSAGRTGTSCNWQTEGAYYCAQNKQ